MNTMDMKVSKGLQIWQKVPISIHLPMCSLMIIVCLLFHCEDALVNWKVKPSCLRVASLHKHLQKFNGTTLYVLLVTYILLLLIHTTGMRAMSVSPIGRKRKKSSASHHLCEWCHGCLMFFYAMYVVHTTGRSGSLSPFKCRPWSTTLTPLKRPVKQSTGNQ